TTPTTSSTRATCTTGGLQARTTKYSTSKPQKAADQGRRRRAEALLPLLAFITQLTTLPFVAPYVRRLHWQSGDYLGTATGSRQPVGARRSSAPVPIEKVPSTQTQTP